MKALATPFNAAFFGTVGTVITFGADLAMERTGLGNDLEDIYLTVITAAWLLPSYLLFVNGYRAKPRGDNSIFKRLPEGVFVRFFWWGGGMLLGGAICQFIYMNFQK